MKGPLFATILLSSAALLTSGDIDVVTDVPRDALSYQSVGKRVPRWRGDVRVDDDDSGGGSRSLVESIALPFHIAARRSRQISGRSRHDPSRPIVIVSMGVRGDPIEKWDPLASYNTERSAYYREHRMIMENPMYVNEPGYMYILHNDGNKLKNRIGPNDQPMPRGKRIRSSWWTDLEEAEQDDHGIRMQRRRGDSSNEHASEVSARETNDRIPGQRNKHSSPLSGLFRQPYFISRGKKTNFPVNAEKLSGRSARRNDDDGGDGDCKFTESFESGEQDDHFERAIVARKRPKSSNGGTTLANKLKESQRYYIHPGKRTHRASGTESTESI